LYHVTHREDRPLDLLDVLPTALYFDQLGLEGAV
jgi:hypothetical protein